MFVVINVYFEEPDDCNVYGPYETKEAAYVAASNLADEHLRETDTPRDLLDADGETVVWIDGEQHWQVQTLMSFPSGGPA